MARFKKGEGGRPKGAQNKTTASFKRAVMACYEGIGGDEAFQKWARKHQTEFYKIAARLIPQEVALQATIRPLVIDQVTTRQEIATALLAQRNEDGDLYEVDGHGNGNGNGHGPAH